jgi:hypothetical protein
MRTGEEKPWMRALPVGRIDLEEVVHDIAEHLQRPDDEVQRSCHPETGKSIARGEASASASNWDDAKASGFFSGKQQS